MILDHVNIGVADLAASRVFSERAPAPLGITFVMANPKPEFWISERGRSGLVHIAFAGADRGTVDRFHSEALAAGGRDNGAPGVRSQYHPFSYGAFVLDPDGNNIEAVTHIAG